MRRPQTRLSSPPNDPPVGALRGFARWAAMCGSRLQND